MHASRVHLSTRDQRIAVIVEPARPVEVAPVVARACGLTAREHEVCLLVQRGLSTAQIAGQLHISTHTVQDHLKTIFDKIGVRSRRALVCRLLLEPWN